MAHKMTTPSRPGLPPTPPFQPPDVGWHPHVWELPVGDAGAGFPSFRREQIFSQIIENEVEACVEPFTRRIPLVTYRSHDNRERFWHVSFYGVESLRNVRDAPVSPLGVADIQDAGLPTVLQAELLFQDASGGRTIRLDVIGKREYDIYAQAVTLNILAPERSFQIGNQPNTLNQNQTLDGLVADTLFGARIQPIIANTTQVFDQFTIPFRLTGTGGGPATLTYVDIPFAARRSQLWVTPPAGGAPLPRAWFVVSEPNAARPPWNDLVQEIAIDATGFSDFRAIPNASQIVFENTFAGDLCGQIVYELEP